MHLLSRWSEGSGARVALAVLTALLLGAVSAALPASAADIAPPDERAIDAERGAFARFLDSHPEISERVQFNPQLAREQGYLNEHPELAAFLEAHPLVKADPRAFVSSHSWNSASSNILDYIFPFLAFICVALSLLWVVRSLLENRRWSKSAAVQAEIHTKLLDRFGSSQEMLAYMQTDAGKRFLESGTLTFEAAETRRTPQMIGRIFWSIQSGLILFLVGAAFLWVRGRVPEGEKAFLVLGAMGLALGAGFSLSAALSYVMSKHLGLLPGASAPAPSERG